LVGIAGYAVGLSGIASVRITGMSETLVGSWLTLMLGLICRERRGVANIGFESLLVLVFYCIGFGVIVLTGGG